MAKTGVMLEGDQAAVVASAKAAELKRELKKLLKVIVEEDDNDSLDVNVMDRAKEALVALRELKVRRTGSFRVDRGGSDSRSVGGGGGGGGGGASSIPEEFRCPLSNQLMKDPVIVATGQTYDKPFIQKWLKSGNRTCPKTQQVLSHTLLIPNYLIKEMISQWCQSRGIKPAQEQPQQQHFLDDDGVTENDRDRFYQLLNGMSSSTTSEQKAAAKELRLLTKKIPSFRGLFGESSDAIPILIRPLCHKRIGDVPRDLQEDLVTTLLNLSIYDSNKKLVGETPMVIPVLIDALKCGTIETRSNAAAALFTLSALDSNKVLIGESGALGPLIDLLDEGHPLAMKDAASAIFNLCIIHENKARAVHEAAVSVVLRKIKNHVQVDELLAILAMLSTHQRAIEELGELRAVACLLGIIRESRCARNKENCIAILYAMCVNDRTKLREMREEESAHGTLSQLARDGTSRAKRKASGILERINRAATLTHTA